MKGYRAAVQYIAENDEPTIACAVEGIEGDPTSMIGFASVQAVAVAFGKEYGEVAVAVIRQRVKLGLIEKRLDEERNQQ